MFGISDPANGLVNMHAPRTDPEIMGSLVDWAPTNRSLPCIASYPPGEVFNGAQVISPDEAAARLVDLGFSSADAAIYLQL